MSIGVYKLINKETGRFYIGKSEDIELRIKTHIFNMRGKNGHKIKRMQEDFDLYGEDSFEYEILEEYNYINKKLMTFRESYLINKYYSCLMYNIEIIVKSKDCYLDNFNKEVLKFSKEKESFDFQFDEKVFEYSKEFSILKKELELTNDNLQKFIIPNYDGVKMNDVKLLKSLLIKQFCVVEKINELNKTYKDLILEKGFIIKELFVEDITNYLDKDIKKSLLML